ncbi:lysophospholipid acyltransferase family protein [Acidithiobacillus sp. ATCC 19703]|uniref:Lysophospholipid acyltransferase family protein n=1 Tax=Acidithiobacillus concretivorus TaxID=3063952 RepID=A0ABS5ZRL3_9PROT|nr:lysophospholipid acyltransferase family protein [Acidithiobacillus concretivorus]
MRLEGRSLRLVARMAAYMIRGISVTLRWEEVGDAQVRQLIVAGKPFILAFWHGRGVMITEAYRRVGGRDIDVLISEHRDGELIAMTLAHWGYSAIRGSTRRGAVKGGRGMLKAALSGRTLAITPDGPRGPREVLHKGVIDLARISGLPIIPVSYSARRAKRFSSWDGFLLPWLATRLVVTWGAAVYIPRDADELLRTELQKQLETSMIDLRKQADTLVGRQYD